MHSYRIHNLSVDTSATDRQRLLERIGALAGVERVTIAADRGEISISPKGGSAPDRAALAEAVAAAGFVLRGRADRWTG